MHISIYFLQSDFLALEVINEHVRFSWSAGEGSDNVDDEMQQIRYSPDETKPFWYRVSARR